MYITSYSHEAHTPRPGVYARSVSHCVLSLMLTAILLLPGLTSCTRAGEEGLLATVPSDVVAVATVDANALLAQVGVSADVTDVAESNLPQSALRFAGDDVATVVALRQGADFDRCVAFVSGSTTIVTALVTDRDAVELALTDRLGLTPSEMSGYKLYKLQNGAKLLALRDRQLWIWQGGMTVADLDVMLKRAADSPVSAKEYLARHLEGEATVNFAINPAEIQSGLAGGVDCILGDITVTDSHIDLNVIPADSLGNRVTMPLKAIDRQVLASLPAGAIATMAVGLDGASIEWEALSAPLALAGGFRAVGVLQTLMPFLKAIDGTVAVGVAYADSSALAELDFDKSVATLIMEMDETSAARAIETIRRQMTFPGVAMTTLPDGTLTIKAGATSIYLANRGGCLTISTRPLTTAPVVQEIERLAEGSNGLIYINLPALSSFIEGAPSFGLKIEGKSDATGIHATLTLPGATAPVMQALIDL